MRRKTRRIMRQITGFSFLSKRTLQFNTLNQKSVRQALVGTDRSSIHISHGTHCTASIHYLCFTATCTKELGETIQTRGWAGDIKGSIWRPQNLTFQLHRTHNLCEHMVQKRIKAALPSPAAPVSACQKNSSCMTRSHCRASSKRGALSRLARRAH